MMTDQLSRREIMEQRSYSRRFPEAQRSLMAFTNDDGTDVLKIDVEYEWEPIGCGDGRVMCSKPKMPEHFHASDENMRIDIADQVGHWHGVKIKVENVEFL